MTYVRVMKDVRRVVAKYQVIGLDWNHAKVFGPKGHLTSFSSIRLDPSQVTALAL